MYDSIRSAPTETLGEGFARRRAGWFDRLVRDLAATLGEISPQLSVRVPRDLGGRDLVAAAVLVRVALAESTARSVPPFLPDAAALLGTGPDDERNLWQALGVAFIRLREAGKPALWSWRLPGLYDALLVEWARRRTAETGWNRTVRELADRWRIPGGTRFEGFCDGPPDPAGPCASLAEYAGRTADPDVAGLVRQLVAAPEVLAAQRARMAAWPDELNDLPHLATLWGESELAVAAGQLCERNRRTRLGPDLLHRTAALARTYQKDVVGAVVGLLSPMERAPLGLRTGRDHGEEALVRLMQERGPAFPDPYPAPLAGEDDYLGEAAPRGPGVQVEGWLREAAAERRGLIDPTWKGVLGSVPWWFTVVDGEARIRAALDFQRDGLTEFALDADDPGDLEVGPPRREPAARLLRLPFRYRPSSRSDMGQLLLLARLGHARLDFLYPAGPHSFRVLRTVRVPLPPELCEQWEEHALARLAALGLPEPAGHRAGR
ncbi:hypothetical protein LO771_27290 [Streptacidiphilus sp. ASG 303]|uniref:hypothetical protein n=1 Tax=Streptacidiphilus sp. ASG 303 TaxID=2896847 RepID=UPI001E4067DC|nr:hypothetical protein [Streptacidiphilus sp. ASG 303]MCD0485988.1 hypothetical protein [Streptacidiphilus sp. ASG 303]